MKVVEVRSPLQGTTLRPNGLRVAPPRGENLGGACPSVDGLANSRICATNLHCRPLKSCQLPIRNGCYKREQRSFWTMSSWQRPKPVADKKINLFL